MITPVALTIAGSDPSGGAGIQADLKTFHQFGVYGEAVITLITVQNTQDVISVHGLSPDLVMAQIAAVVEDIPAAAKTGVLGSSAVAHAVSRAAKQFHFPLVVDPVTISTHGVQLAELDLEIIKGAFLVTPNLDEASAFAGFVVDDVESMRHAAKALAGLGAVNVLVKGGHLRGKAVDVLYMRGQGFLEFSADRIETRHTHGTGCTYSAAITAELAKGTSLVEAVQRAKAFITEAIRTNPGLGKGSGPLNHHARQ